MKKASVGFINRPDIAKEKISELDNRSIETSQVEMKRKKWEKPPTRTSKNFGTTSKEIIGIPEGEERKNREEMFEVMMSEKFPKLVTDIKP